MIEDCMKKAFQPETNRSRIVARLGLMIWMCFVISVFLVEHIPLELWAFLQRLGLLQVFEAIQQRVLAVFSAEYLS
jgi:hypothetical protein